jgi:hypothetical protein
MDRRFLVEAKSFVLSVLEGAFVLRVVQKRKIFPVRYY